MLAVALGWLVTTYVGFTSGVGPAVVLTLSGLVCAWVIMSGPVPCLAAIAALAASGLDPGVAELGEFNATASDIFWAGLAGWWLLKVIDRAVRGVPSRPGVAFGQIPAIAFFVYAVLALLWLHELDSGPLVSLLRVIHTFLLAFLAASMIETSPRPAPGARGAGRGGRDRDRGGGLQRRRPSQRPRRGRAGEEPAGPGFRCAPAAGAVQPLEPRTCAIRWRRLRSSAWCWPSRSRRSSPRA